VDLLEALLLAACFAVIVIPVPVPHFRGNNRITDLCVTRNDPRKENRKFYPLLYSVIIRFSFSITMGREHKVRAHDGISNCNFLFFYL